MSSWLGARRGHEHRANPDQSSSARGLGPDRHHKPGGLMSASAAPRPEQKSRGEEKGETPYLNRLVCTFQFRRTSRVGPKSTSIDFDSAIVSLDTCCAVRSGAGSKSGVRADSFGFHPDLLHAVWSWCERPQVRLPVSVLKPGGVDTHPSFARTCDRPRISFQVAVGSNVVPGPFELPIAQRRQSNRTFSEFARHQPPRRSQRDLCSSRCRSPTPPVFSDVQRV